MVVETLVDWSPIAVALVLLACTSERLRRISRRRRDALSAPTAENQLLFEEQVRHRAFHDALTQLPNRALFYDRVQQALEQHAGESRLVAVLFVDLDAFADVNRACGHETADALLVQVSDRLRSCLRATDTSARLGGDDFGVLLTNVASRSEAIRAAARIADLFSQPIQLGDDSFELTVSVGITVPAHADTTADELMAEADIALYAAKQRGAGSYELFHEDLRRDLLAELDGAANTGPRPGGSPSMYAIDEQRLQISRLLEDPDSITIMYQPVVDLRTGRVAGYEALSRFSSVPYRPPNAWFAQAASVGLGVELEAAAVVRALATDSRPHGAFLTLNVSPTALTSPVMLQALPEDLTGIVLEITENELASSEAGFQAVMEGLRRRGARIAVDDAGAGYAGLRQLMVLRPDVIKLDRGLVDGVSDDPAKLALVEAFVRFSRRVQAEVCAEGIETLEDLRTLADADVSYGQGYVLARPAPPWAEPVAEARSFLRRLSSDALRDPLASGFAHLSDDRALEEATTRLSRAGSCSDLEPALEFMARCLHAHQLSFSVIRHDTGTIEPLCRFGSHAPLTSYPSADRPLAAEALRTQQVRHVLGDEQDADEHEAALMRQQAERSLLLVPIVAGGVSVGLLEVYSPEPRSWTRLEVARARLFASQLAGLLRSEASRKFHIGVLDALADHGDNPAREFLRTACNAYGWDLGVAWTFSSPDDDALTLSESWTSPAFASTDFLKVLNGLAIVPGLGIAGRAWASRQPVWVHDVGADRGFLPREAAELAGLSSTLALPVRVDGRLISVAQLFSVEPRPVQADSALALMHDAERIARIVVARDRRQDSYDDLLLAPMGVTTLQRPA